jgi:hypothetical protein
MFISKTYMLATVAKGTLADAGDRPALSEQEPGLGLMG